MHALLVKGFLLAEVGSARVQSVDVVVDQLGKLMNLVNRSYCLNLWSSYVRGKGFLRVAQTGALSECEVLQHESETPW